MPKFPAVRDISRKKSRSNAKSTRLIADKARIIRYLSEQRRRCKCDASRETAGEFERVAILGLHRRQSRRQRAAFQAEGVTFFTGTTPDLAFILGRSIGLDFGPRMASSLGSEP